ncbi:MAG: beta-1,6-N-acetylglucosaminyltransferase [Sulfuriferula sp.]|nr:beta-1,6-N-acetylglucosaminyltransferase [Sulfuriferula sp.]
MTIPNQEIKIVFGILSANNPADIVQQSIDALGSDCIVIVHHDFNQRPDFVLTGNNVWVLENPVHTKWGNWTLAEAVLRLLRHALINHQFDYFQLLSDSCLPIRPAQEFAQTLLSQRPDVMMDLIDIRTDKNVFLSHAYRCYTQSNTLLHRIFRRNRLWALGPRPHPLEKIAGLGIPLAQSAHSPTTKIMQAIGKSVTAALYLRDLITSKPRVYVGSTWFCASRQVCNHIVEQANNEKLVAYFSKLTCPDEIFFPTIIGNSQFHNIAPANHATLWQQRGTGPEELKDSDLPVVMNSGKFFARKFPKQHDHAVRSAVLEYVSRNEEETTKNA